MASLSQFRSTYPKLSITLGVSDRSVDLIAEGVDCVLRIGELPNSSLVARRLGALVMITCAAPGYLEKAPALEQPDDLDRHGCVNFLSGISKRTLPWHFRQNGASRSLLPDSSMLVSDAAAYVQCARSGFGLIQVPGILVDRYLRDGTLVEVLAQYRPAPRPVSLVYPSRSHVAPPLRVFSDWLQQHFLAIDRTWLE